MKASLLYLHRLYLPYLDLTVLSFSFSIRISSAHGLYIMGGEKYPEVQGGGSLILAWQVRHRKVLVIGGGEVSLHTRPLFTPR